MGAQNFYHEIKAKSAREGFDALCKEASYECGHDRYNGTINTCSLGRGEKLADKYTKSISKKAYKLAEENDFGSKWTANYFDLGVVEYRVITTKKKTVKTEPPKFQLCFAVVEYDYMEKRKILKYFDTKKQADDDAFKRTLKGECVAVIKTYKVVKGDNILTTFENTVRTYKSKPSLKPLPNRRIEEIHRYAYYGLAAS